MIRYVLSFGLGVAVTLLSFKVAAGVKERVLLNRVEVVRLSDAAGAELNVKSVQEIDGILLEDYGSHLSLSSKSPSVRCVLQHSGKRIRSAMLALDGEIIFSTDISRDGEVSNMSVRAKGYPGSDVPITLVDVNGDGVFDLLKHGESETETAYLLKSFNVTKTGEGNSAKIETFP